MTTDSVVGSCVVFKEVRGIFGCHHVVPSSVAGLTKAFVVFTAATSATKKINWEVKRPVAVFWETLVCILMATLRSGQSPGPHDCVCGVYCLNFGRSNETNGVNIQLALLGRVDCPSSFGGQIPRAIVWWPLVSRTSKVCEFWASGIRTCEYGNPQKPGTE